MSATSIPDSLTAPVVWLAMCVRGALFRHLCLCMASVAVCGVLSSPGVAADRATADLTCLALTIYHEARGEPDSGKIAVAHVVLNRARDSRFPQTICEVVYQRAAAERSPCEFSWTCDEVSDQPTNMSSWRDSVRIAQAVYWGQATDPSDGAMWYHADYVTPAWATALGAPQRLGHHLFYRDTSDPLVEPAGAPRPPLPPARKAIVAGAMPETPAPRLPEVITSFLSDLRITMVICSPDVRNRAARINDAMFRQGDELTPGLVLASITSEGIVVRYQDRWFRFTL